MRKVGLSFFALFALLCGCGKEEVAKGRTLRMSSLYELFTADPQKVHNNSDFKIIQSAFEGLLVPDPETMKPLPGVAERWTISPDGKVYEFFIRDTAKWSDGSPVTADDFVFSVQRALSSKFSCSFSELFFPIKNAQDFFNRKIRDFSKVGIIAINSRTLRIELEKKTPYFLTILMHPCWSPLNKRVVESFNQYGKNFESSNVFKVRVISNGPFIFAERVPGTCLLLKRNIKYWDCDNVLIDSVMVFPDHNQTIIMKKFFENKVDIAEIPVDSDLAVGECSKTGELIPSAMLGCFGLAFNTSKPIFRDHRVRQALAMAVDREKILHHIDKNELFAAYNFIPDCGPKYSAEHMFEYNIPLAKKLLAEAGYGDNKKFPPISILCNESESKSIMSVLSLVADSWKTNLGIDVSIHCLDFDTFFIHRKTGNFELIKISYGAPYCDPGLMIKTLTSNNPKNYGKWLDRKYDFMLSEIDKSDNHKNRRLLIKNAEKYLAHEMPIIPLFFDSKSYIVKNCVSGWFPNVMNLHPIKFVYFSE